MKTELIKSESRGKAEHGWLHSNFSFSFSQYYDPNRMGFGALRVLNDDIIEPKKGFGFHPHNNMEIVSIPLTGLLEHRDNMGNVSIIKTNDVQIMSAGTGVVHSEINPSDTETGNFLQIWVLPKEPNIDPRYQQLTYNFDENYNRLIDLVSPEKSEMTLWINQDAYFSIGKYNAVTTEEYKIKRKGSGVYLFLIEGDILAGDVKLNKRDALQIWDCESFKFTTTDKTEALIIEIPMDVE